MYHNIYAHKTICRHENICIFMYICIFYGSSSHRVKYDEDAVCWWSWGNNLKELNCNSRSLFQRNKQFGFYSHQLSMNLVQLSIIKQTYPTYRWQACSMYSGHLYKKKNNSPTPPMTWFNTFDLCLSWLSSRTGLQCCWRASTLGTSQKVQT